MKPIIILSAQGWGSDEQAQMVERWGQRRRSKHSVCLIKCAWCLTSLHHSVCLLVRKSQEHLLVGLFCCNIHIRHSNKLLQERAAVGASNIRQRNWIFSPFCSCCLLCLFSFLTTVFLALFSGICSTIYLFELPYSFAIAKCDQKRW